MEFDISNYLINFSLKKNLDSFLDNSQKTQVDDFKIKNKSIKKYINEFWTSKQRQASSIHEISYRACFKAQLPSFFIKLLTKTNDIIYDPFSGRGTTIIEAGLIKRYIISNDINPLSEILAKPRINIPTIDAIKDRLDRIPLNLELENDIDLTMFYHEKTEREILSLKNYLYEKKKDNLEDDIDRWIRMVATNRLTGHSIGFFSVYTLPPNQAVSQESQIKINRKRRQKPEYRGVKERILKKSISLIRNLTKQQKDNLKEISKTAIFLTKDARNTPEIKGNLIKLTVTSPPFLKTVQYLKDNWLRCWFNSINARIISKIITMESDVNRWSKMMGNAFKELYRITKPNGWVAFEVGEIQKGKIKLEEYIVPEGLNAGFVCKGIIINEQHFTKTSNIWGIKNKESGTNTNRIILFRKEI